jgi:catechol 2,3-dioxygenase-like lactoylglutathione lyase family enzyme
MPTLNGVLETALYVEDLGRAIRFYKEVFHLEVMEADQRFCAFIVGGRQVLLLFRKGGTTTPITTPGGAIPPHDGRGHLHFAFSISGSELPAWEKWLDERGVEVESKVRWPGGGVSLYLRDPDGHLVELATPGVWSIY